jgi:hypothetical protein
MRACLVFGPALDLEGAGTDCLRGVGLPAFRPVERVAALGFDLGFVMGSSEVCATPSAAPPQPRPAKSQPAGQDPEAGCSRPSHPSNALFGLECQSILSKIVAGLVAKLGCYGHTEAAQPDCWLVASFRQGTRAMACFHLLSLTGSAREPMTLCLSIRWRLSELTYLTSGCGLRSGIRMVNGDLGSQIA